MSNGVHTIAWAVFDNGGRGEGLGSRYFSVANGAGTARAADDGAATPSVTAGRVRPVRGEGEARPVKRIDSRVFFRRDASFGSLERLDPLGDGSYAVIVPQIERIE